jgi:hypothetical protein
LQSVENQLKNKFSVKKSKGILKTTSLCFFIALFANTLCQPLKTFRLKARG